MPIPSRADHDSCLHMCLKYRGQPGSPLTEDELDLLSYVAGMAAAREQVPTDQLLKARALVNKHLYGMG